MASGLLELRSTPTLVAPCNICSSHGKNSRTGGPQLKTEEIILAGAIGNRKEGAEHLQLISLPLRKSSHNRVHAGVALSPA